MFSLVLFYNNDTFIKVLVIVPAALSVIALISALVVRLQAAASDRPHRPTPKEAIPSNPAPLAPDRRPVDRVWDWFKREIEDFSPQARETAIALRTTNNARGLDAFCRQQGATGGQS
ncbi:hypothetical protein [Sphingomonas natans]|uniref:hypothetical protein n=1 Tax=Sphingomonas natans TaxID=3063330 RepID=UPI0026E2893A|nr:hypothetical protein [Sphingomonas sp. BIUV-7]